MSRKNSVEDCHKLARRRSGNFLSKEYINAHTKYLWECKKCKNQWWSSYNDVQQGCWCSICAGNVKNNLKKCHILAKKNNGKCLSIEYINAHTKYLWECKEGHQFEMTYNSIQQGRWCSHKTCRGLKSARNRNNSKTFKHWKTNEEIIATASYEIAVIKYLNKNKINYEWQKHVFKTDILTPRGHKSTYRPDLYFPDKNLYVEIKGYFYKDAKEKWEWFHKNYSNSELWNKKKLKKMKIL